MTQQVRRRFSIETVAVIASVVLFLLTMAWPDWIELVLRVDPDQHSGLLEWLIVVVAFAAAIGLTALARSERRRRLFARPRGGTVA